MLTLITKLMAQRHEDEGAVAIEYALLAALIGLTLVVGALFLGEGLSDFFTAIANYLADFLP